MSSTSPQQEKIGFYIIAGGNKSGPYSGARIKQMAADGTIAPDMILEDLKGNRRRAGEVPGLTFPQQSAPPPAQPTSSTPPPCQKRRYFRDRRLSSNKYLPSNLKRSSSTLRSRARLFRRLFAFSSAESAN